MVEIELYLRRTFCFLLPKSTTTDEEKKTKSKEIKLLNQKAVGIHLNCKNSRHKSFIKNASL